MASHRGAGFDAGQTGELAATDASLRVLAGSGNIPSAVFGNTMEGCSS